MLKITRSGIALLTSSFLFACSSLTPNLDQKFGESVTMMRAQQTINPEASLNSDPVLGQDGKTAKGALDNYYDTFRKPPAEASSTFTLGVGNSK